MKWPLYICALCFGLLCPSRGYAQHAEEHFGKSRIQYRQRSWLYVSSEHFQFYYYDKEKGIAIKSIRYLENNFRDIVGLLGYSPRSRIRIFLHNSVVDLQQTNIGLGFTRAESVARSLVNPYVEVAHTGSLDELKEHLIYKITDTMLKEMIFGGSFKEKLKNAVLLNLPDWFLPGLARYVSSGWDEDMDEYVRQLVHLRKVRRIGNFKGREAELVGQSVWHYIARKYGKSSISTLLQYTRLIGNVHKGIEVLLGVGFRSFIADWAQYYRSIGDSVRTHYVSPADSLRIMPRRKKSLMYTSVKISPDGQKMAYTANDRGRFFIKIRYLPSGNESTILSGGARVFGQDVDYNVPLIGWVNANMLGVIGVRRGVHIFWLYDLIGRRKTSRKLRNFNNIRSLNFSQNGRLGVLSADRGGQNDLFLISARRNRTRQLTNDAYDDLTPSFLPGSNTIVFSSNRMTDTINTVVQHLEQLPDYYNLYFFNLDTTSNTVSRITNTLGKNYLPRAFDANAIYYLSDQRGISNIFRYDISKDIYTQVTNFEAAVKSYDLDFARRNLAFVMQKNLENNIFLIPNFNPAQQVFRPPTQRVKVQQAQALKEKKTTLETPIKPTSIKDLVNARLRKVQGDRAPFPVDTLSVPSVDTLAVDTLPSVPDRRIRTEDYTFEDETSPTDRSSADQFLKRYMQPAKRAELRGPFAYKPLFIYENLLTDFVNDPLTGFAVRFGVRMNDILENYRFLGGLKISFDGESSDIYAEAQYIPYRADITLRLRRKVVLWNGASRFQRYTWQKIEAGISMPFSTRWHLAAYPFLGYTAYNSLSLNERPFPAPPVSVPGTERFYGGAQTEIVYDQSIVTGLNTIEGTRGKIHLTHYEGLDNARYSFSHAYIDVRHYQKIYRQAVLALRGYAGAFFGNAPKKYALGGMDNWLFNSRNTEGTDNPLARTEGYNDQLIFTEFATNMRGFDYAVLYGSNVLLTNIELRLPLIRILSTNPISSNFLKNLQLTAFYDLGTSWTGSFEDLSNGPTTRTIPNRNNASPFLIEIADFLNPWIYSYGAGFRAKIVGFYSKFDVAWPVQNYRTGKPRFYFTLGLDF